MIKKNLMSRHCKKKTSKKPLKYIDIKNLKHRIFYSLIIKILLNVELIRLKV